MKTQKRDVFPRATGRLGGMNKKPFVALFIIITGGFILYFFLKNATPSYVPISYYPPSVLNQYFDAEEKYGIPWFLPAGIDLQEKKEASKVSSEHIREMASRLAAYKEQNIQGILSSYRKDSTFVKGVLQHIKRLQSVDKVYRDKTFPIDTRYEYSYQDDWGNKRTYGGERTHEGTDIMCKKGTPIHSIGNGTIEKKGWNELGGWRIGIRGDDGMYYYYAHMSRYAPEWKIGDRVLRGEIIGYAGDSGYGSEGTTGKFAPHLHFGIYERDKAVSPFPFLKAWEKK